MDTMIGIGRIRVFLMTVSATLLLAGPARASQSHCEGGGESGPVNRAELPPESLAAEIMSWSGSDLGEAACIACAMAGCPLALCPAGTLLDSPVMLAPSGGVGTSLVTFDSSPAASRTLEPPKPPPNTPSPVFTV